MLSSINAQNPVIHLKIVVNNFSFIFHELMLTVKPDPVINAPEQAVFIILSF
jgi:hypothetical protein